MEEKSWNSLKKEYCKNLLALDASINETHDSISNMIEIYNAVMKKASDTSSDKMKEFADTWIKNIDIESLERFDLIKKDFKELLESPTEEKFQEIGRNLEEETYKNSIAVLDSYKYSMRAFYNAWINMWPKMEIHT